jgi:hypothetical protein
VLEGRLFQVPAFLCGMERNIRLNFYILQYLISHPTISGQIKNILTGKKRRDTIIKTL